MRKIIVLSFISLDGVMQAPGGPEEDPTGGFKHGGWLFGYSDNFLLKVMIKQMSKPFDLLLGRKTYEIFAAYSADMRILAKIHLQPGLIAPRNMSLQKCLQSLIGTTPN